jgi:hypothetical protein
MFDEKYGRRPINESQNPYTCGISGRTFTTNEIKDRVEYLARSLKKEFGWEINGKKGGEWEKVAGIFSLNTVSCPS